MRILYLHQHFSVAGAAAPARSFHLACRMVSHGHTVTLHCGTYAGGASGLHGPFRRGRRSGLVDGIRVVEHEIAYRNDQGMWGRAAGFARFALATSRAALSREMDLVYASSTPLTVAIPMVLATWARGTRTVFELRDPWPALPVALGIGRWPLVTLMRLLEGAGLRAAGAVVTLAPGVAADVARRFPSRRVVIVPNGLAPGRVVARDREAGAPMVALYAGTLGRANGVEFLVAVARCLAAARVVIQVAGAGGDLARLRALSAGLPGIVFTGPMHGEAMARLWDQADVALHCLAPVPEFAETTSPNKLLEALAHGLPVVTNCPGWLGRLVFGAGAGVAVAADDPEAMAAALTALAANPARRLVMGRAASNLAQTRFAPERLADRVSEVVSG